MLTQPGRNGRLTTPKSNRRQDRCSEKRQEAPLLTRLSLSSLILDVFSAVPKARPLGPLLCSWKLSMESSVLEWLVGKVLAQKSTLWTRLVPMTSIGLFAVFRAVKRPTPGTLTLLTQNPPLEGFLLCMTRLP